MTDRRRSPPGNPPAPSPGAAQQARLALIALALVLIATLVVYWPVTGFQFVHYDDNAFVFENPRMQEGLTLRSIGWAFTASVAANWHPLTVLTHLLDCSLHGLDAGGHHLTSLLIHLADAALLFLLLRRLALSLGASLLVTALFALHPLNVESVAWVAERKNVLSMLFLFLTLLAYVRYARAPARRPYLAALLLFAAGLMSKAMLVSVPVLLLLLDFWPLRRGSLATAGAALRDLFRLLPEKLPFVALALAACVLTVVTQRQAEALAGLQSFPAAARLANAAVSYVAYVRDLFFPAHLSVFYPWVRVPAWQGACAGVALLAASAVAWRQRLRRPYVLIGWLWYLVALLPVIGLVQVGSQSRADRYAYLPLIGLFVILALLAEEAAARLRVPPRAAQVAGALLAVALSVTTRHQVRVWRDTVTLFEHAIGEVQGAYVAYNGLGIYYGKEHRYAEARKDFEAALAIQPDYYDAWNNLGQISLDQGELEGAVRYYEKAITYRRSNPKTLNNLGTALARLGRFREAAGYFEAALGVDPGYATARANYASALAQLNRAGGAAVEPAAGVPRTGPAP